MSTKTRARIALFLVALGLIAGVLAWSAVEANAAKAVHGRCGMHIGSLIRRSQGGSLYHFRIGPKYLGTLRPGTCRGIVRVRSLKPGAAGTLAWKSYSMVGFNDHTALLIGSTTATVTGCNAVGKTVAGAIEVLVGSATDEVAFPLISTGAASFMCGVGASALFSFIPDGPTTLNKVHMIK